MNPRSSVACLIFFLQVLLSFSMPFSSRAAGPEDLPAGVEVRPYTGWDPSIFLNATERPVEAVIVPAVGGRVVHFSLKGENILLENPSAQGRTMDETGRELLLGGYECDVGPRPPGTQPHSELIQGRHGWTLKGDFAAHVNSMPDVDLGVVVEKDFLLAPDTGDLGVMQRMRNVSEKEVSYFLRDRTICRGGGFILLPLNKHSRFKAGWSQRRHVNGRTFYDGAHPSAIQAKVLDGVLVVSAVGDVTEIAADSMAGWIAYARGRLLFVKYFQCSPGGRYSEGGNTVEAYFDQRAVELSPLSAETKIAPGQEMSFAEKWTLTDLPHEVTTWDEARRLVRKIPPSPFAAAFK
jgi:hypothetical protein